MTKTTIIVPCAGRSSRFPNLRPKFLLVNPSGNLMVIDAIAKLPLQGSDLVVTVLREHEKQYGITKMFRKFFPRLGVRVCVLPKPTRSQSETVYETLDRMKVRGPFLVKDSDNIFRLDRVAEAHNYVSVLRLEDVELVNARNKSYVQSDVSGVITNIEEKKVISNTFSVGGYFFRDPEQFMTSFRRLSRRHSALGIELYISGIINYLIFEENVKFKINPVAEYLDLGTAKDWQAYRNTVKTYFFDLDGIIVKNGGEYFPPYWGTTSAIADNAALVKELYDRGNQIIITTSRRESYRAATVRQLKKFRVPCHQLLMGVLHSQRVLVNDFSNSNPYPSAAAVNIPRDSNELRRYLGA